MYDVAIIGCGVIGAATAYQLSRYDLKIAVFEANNDVAAATTKANSAIIHAGYDPVPGTLTAKLNVEGNAMTEEICAKLSVPYKKVGSLVLSFEPENDAMLEELLRRAKANGVPHAAILTRDEALAIEPNLNPEIRGALYTPDSGIICPWEYALAMAETAVRNGTELFLSCPVTGLAPEDSGYVITTPKGTYRAKYVINAAGVHADDVHALLEEPDFRITPRRGQYYLLDKSEGGVVKHTIFQCPTKMGKGILVSPTVHGNLIVGPDAEDLTDKADVSVTAAGLVMLGNMARLSVPTLTTRNNIRNFAGLRAESDSEDFIIRESENFPGFFDLAGIRSPGLTASPAIGRYTVGLLEKAGAKLTEKKDFIDHRERIVFRDLPFAEQQKLVEKDPRYGRIICRCETITEGEILDTFKTPIPPVSINGVKRRCNAGMGRCQGGFCSPRVHAIIARELGIPMEQVLMEDEGTFIVQGETK